MAYQTFPWQQGGSLSFEKLKSLYLPVLKGKSVLDVGCNTGFFCGWAAFQQAAHVKGIDRHCSFIAQAKDWFPQCSFSCMSWTELGPETYDVILCLSAIHYAEDQQALLHLLMSRVNPDGVLVLEAGVAEGDEDAFVPVKRSIDTRLFPTRAKMKSMLRDYAFKGIGRSVSQGGDPTPRHVYHIYHKRPYAVLLMDEHYSGKSSMLDAMIKPDVYRIAGEVIYHQIADGSLPAKREIRELMRFVGDTQHMNPPKITADICRKGLLPELMTFYTGLAGHSNFVLEHYIPYEYRLEACECLHKAGYFVVDVAMYEAHNKPWHRSRPPYTQYQRYIDYLHELSAIEEEAYLAANPDVAVAIQEGRIPNARFHFMNFGKREKRKLAPEGWNRE